MLQTIWVCKNSSLEGTFCLPLLWGSILDLPCSAAVCRRGAQLPTRCVFSAPSFPCFPITSLLLLLSATAHSFFFDLMRIINHLCKSPVSERGVAGFETGESPRLVTRKRDLLDPLQTTWVLWESEREKGERARARVFFIFILVGSEGEWAVCARASCATRYLWVATGSISPVWTTFNCDRNELFHGGAVRLFRCEMWTWLASVRIRR